MKQNVVLIVTDQQQAQALGCVNSSYKTPNLDKLAARGVRFSHNYCASGQCTPSRAAMMTGCYPHEVGVLQIGHALSQQYRTIGKHFREAGYHTAYFGKWHLFADIKDHGFDTIDYREDGVDHGTIDPSEQTQQGLDARATAKALNFLSEVSDQQPFFLVISWYAPHPPFRAIDPYVDQFSLEDMPVPVSFYQDDLSSKPSWQKIRAAYGESLLTEEQVREDARNYRSQVSYLDWNVGRVLDILEQRRIIDRTVVVFTTDHGDMQGSHRLRYKGVLSYEELYRIPLIIYDPNRNPARKVISDLVSNVSLPATLAELAGLPVPEKFHGASLVDKLTAQEISGEQMIYIEHWKAYWGFHPLRGLITPHWKYVYYFEDKAEELYDREDDPHELVNQADNPSYQDIKTDLRVQVDDWWSRTGGLTVKPIEVKTAGWIDPSR